MVVAADFDWLAMTCWIGSAETEEVKKLLYSSAELAIAVSITIVAIEVLLEEWDRRTKGSAIG